MITRFKTTELQVNHPVLTLKIARLKHKNYERTGWNLRVKSLGLHVSRITRFKLVRVFSRIIRPLRPSVTSRDARTALKPVTPMTSRPFANASLVTPMTSRLVENASRPVKNASRSLTPMTSRSVENALRFVEKAGL